MKLVFFIILLIIHFFGVSQKITIFCSDSITKAPQEDIYFSFQTDYIDTLIQTDKNGLIELLILPGKLEYCLVGIDESVRNCNIVEILDGVDHIFVVTIDNRNSIICTSAGVQYDSLVGVNENELFNLLELIKENPKAEFELIISGKSLEERDWMKAYIENWIRKEGLDITIKLKQENSNLNVADIRIFNWEE